MMSSMENHIVITIHPEDVYEDSMMGESGQYTDKPSLWNISDPSELSFVDFTNYPSDETQIDYDFKYPYDSNSETNARDHLVSDSNINDENIFRTKPKQWWVVSKKVRDYINSFRSISPVNSQIDYSDIDLEMQEVSEDEEVTSQPVNTLLYRPSYW